MQLKNKPRNIRGALALATTSMLTGVHQTANAAEESTWEVDSAILFYSETDRVSVVEPVVRMRKQLDDEESVTVRIVVDSLTGSSPNGAISQPFAQTFTTPSGNSTYTTPPNETPLDPTFHDTRGAINGEWEKPITDTVKGFYSVNVSKEFDYSSAGLASTFTWDTNQRLTTWSAGLAYNFDQVNPEGGIPTGLTPAPTTTEVKKSIDGDTDDKSVFDVLLGVTQVIDRKTLMQFNFSYGNDSGYMTDPYKILSVLDDGGNLSETPYLYEKRPDSRSRQALYWKTVHIFTEDVLHISYRYYWDDWGISSHTVDGRYRFELGGGHYLQPHARYYLQDKADFYYYNLTEASTPEFASADYRLADMSTTTLGLKYGVELNNDSEFTIRAEMMKQKSEGDAPFPDVDAVILQLGYNMKF
jgi:hypothetical protein